MKKIVNKPKIAILSLKNSYGYGGVLSSLKVAYDFCEKYFEPTVFFLSFEPSLSTSLKRMKFSSSCKPLTYFGMNGIEVGARWAFWEPGHYKFNLDHWEKLLSGYDYFLAVSGTCITAHPLALLNKKFGMLVSTPYSDDRARRIKDLRGLRYVIDRLASKKMNKIEKFILGKACLVWALSNYSRLEFQKILQNRVNNLICCGHPVDCSVIPAIESRRDKVIIAVGRFNDPRKNAPMLLRAFRRINDTIPEVKLYVVGSKPDKKEILEFSGQPFFNNIVFTGQVSLEALDSFYKRASLMLLTSYQEGFGIVGVEALLNGIPIIATNCGGPADYVINDLTGYLVSINDDECMAKYAIDLLQNKEKLENMARSAQNFVVQKFSVTKIEELFKDGFLIMHPELKELFEE
jgi:glycosyltransferase involved in cell wall biosynthesis